MVEARGRLAARLRGLFATCLPGRAGREEWLDYHHYKDIPTLINNRQNNRRRGRGGGPRPNGVNPGNDRGNRIDNRARGNANQLYEKYKTLARDAQMQGDRVMGEYYYQFADHYFRVLSESRSRFDDQRRFRDDFSDRDDQEDYGDENYPGEAVNGAQPNRNYHSEEGNAPGHDQSVEAQQAPARPEVRPEGAQETNAHAEDAERSARRGRGGRRPRSAESPQYAMPIVEEQEERIDVDRLPPAFAVSEGEAAAEPVVDKPKRRGRPPRAASQPAEA